MFFRDALYGDIDLDIPTKVLRLPELQRLREIRLCNINSPFITGGSNINRFEHAIGTGYLAQLFSEKNKLAPKDRSTFIIASLLHDVVTAPFGHSLEYLFSALGKKNYEHSNLDTIFTGKTVQNSRPFYCAQKAAIPNSGDIFDVKATHALLTNRHHLSPYLSNEIDIDNIDNVFRFAFHIGIPFPKDTPRKLALSLRYINKDLTVEKSDLKLYEIWFKTRVNLYNFLLEDYGEFVSKALLERIFIELVDSEIITEIDWILTDSGIINLALSCDNADVRTCAQRLMLMDFPQKYVIFESFDYEKIDVFLKTSKIKIINLLYKKGVFLHFIKDVNKTFRPIKCNVTSTEGVLSVLPVGTSQDRYLIGIFADSTKLINLAIDEIQRVLDVRFSALRSKRSNAPQQLTLI